MHSCLWETRLRATAWDHALLLATWHAPSQPQPDKPVLDLPNPVEWKAELTLVVDRWLYTAMAICLSQLGYSNHVKSNSRPSDRESGALAVTPSSHVVQVVFQPSESVIASELYGRKTATKIENLL